MQPLDKKRHGHHQKVLIVDSVPINPWYIEKVFRAALIDAQTLHSSLDQHERDQLVKKFNDPGDLKVLITTYDVGSDSICTKPATVLFSLCQVGAGAKKLSRTRASSMSNVLFIPSMTLDPPTESSKSRLILRVD